MTLTEFLLARIAEDDAAANLPDLDPIPVNGWGPDRVLAECEAKRRIVELHEGGDHECSVYDHNGERDGFHYILDGDDCSTLRLLALPYADHPDYRDEWKP